MDEKTILALCRKNNRQAQQNLYQQHASFMLGVCYRYTKSRDDAEDVLQEGFVKVFTQIDQFNGKGSLQGWIYRIMVTTAISYLRRHQRYRSQMEFSEPNIHPIVDPRGISNLQTEDLMELVRRLPTGYQTVFNLAGIEGYDHTEISELLGISVQTSRSQYSRARALLIKWIDAAEKQTAIGKINS